MIFWGRGGAMMLSCTALMGKGVIWSSCPKIDVATEKNKLRKRKSRLFDCKAIYPIFVVMWRDFCKSNLHIFFFCRQQIAIFLT
jgi:hypothetical protein